MRRLLLQALCCLTLPLLSAEATPITYAITVHAFGYDTFASYTLTLDPTLSYTNATAGLLVNTLQAGVQGASGFTYNPGGGGPYSFSTLTIGGLSGGVNSTVTGTNDYYVSLLGFPSSPAFNGAVITQTTAYGNYSDSMGSVSVAQVAATPEPSSYLLLATGLLGAAAAARRRLT